MNLRDRLARLEQKARKVAARGDERHHEIDEQFQQAWEYAQQFEARIAQVEANTARLDALEAAVAAHTAEKSSKAHK